MGMRKTPQEIRQGVEEGFTEEPWEDLLEEFNFAGDRAEDNALAAQCALFLEKTFPGETFGWQDFDTLLSNRLIGRWDTVANAAVQILGEEVQDIEDPDRRHKEHLSLESLSDTEIVAALKRKPGLRVFDATDREGTAILFTELYGLDSVRR